ncbi:hypothetical protein GCM10025792_41300 [Pseudonocardia tropica]
MAGLSVVIVGPFAGGSGTGPSLPVVAVRRIGPEDDSRLHRREEARPADLLGGVAGARTADPLTGAAILDFSGWAGWSAGSVTVQGPERSRVELQRSEATFASRGARDGSVPILTARPGPRPSAGVRPAGRACISFT